MINRQIILRERPEGAISAEHFEIIEGALPEHGPNEALVRVAWLGSDVFRSSPDQPGCQKTVQLRPVFSRDSDYANGGSGELWSRLLS